jgi:hypothetical protein
MPWVVRFPVSAVVYAGAHYGHVFLRGPQWIDLAERSLPDADRHHDSVTLELSEHVRPFDSIVDAVAAALRLNGTVRQVEWRSSAGPPPLGRWVLVGEL